ncbi:YbgF trimerization domain-containing protein [Acinetobacter stercoris]|uniref:Tol-pal system protein YbgF n=1 Tax=Acinetobacter stercoris TaxID=2126983 RepID=A0A2U3MUB7_9GAMM|nr:YbgF trimerization domain-containing protein [Acinetobacter stercoris]SPL69002.1 tol-pal system protein YbgF [Acinetobacter stercoris]
MLNKHALILVSLLGSASTFAIPIESRGLSQNDPGSSSVPTAVASNVNWDLMQKNQQLESQLRELRGKIEEQDHAIDQLSKDLANRYTDLDQRLELLNQKVDPDSAQTEEDSGNNSSNSNEQQPTTPNNQDSTPNKTTTQNNEKVAVQPNNATNTSDPKELEKAAYTVALDAYKKGGAKQAIAPMQNFIKNNPNSIYTGNAYFWLAEFNLAIDPPNYNEAKKNYEIVAAKFPNSAKAPRALYQLYSIAKDVNKNNATATVYKNKLLNTYPKSEEAGYFKKS